MNRVVSSRESRLQSGPPASPLVGFDRLWVELKQREARLASCCGQERDPTPTIFRDPSRLPKVSETMRKDPMPPPGPVPSVWVEYERRQAREQGPKVETGAGEGGCACQDKPKPKPRRAGPDASGVRQVSGEWVGRVLSLPAETRRQIEGKTVHVDPEAWHAVQAALKSTLHWGRIRRDVAKRRARIWSAKAEEVQQARDPWSKNGYARPSQANAPDSIKALSNDCCAEVIWVEDGYRYVDVERGDDDATGKANLIFDHVLKSGETAEVYLVIDPWRTLRQAFRWMNGLLPKYTGAETCIGDVRIYLRRGQTWTGREEGVVLETTGSGAPTGPAGGYDVGVTMQNRWRAPGENAYKVEAVFALRGLSGASSSPLVIGAYGDGDDPLLDGRDLRPTEPQFRDPRRALFIADCCYVQVSNLQIRGFGVGIAVTGASRHHVYSDLSLYDHASGGIGFGINEDYATLYRDENGLDSSLSGAELSEALAELGVYPEDIVVADSRLWSIGYDTGCQDIGLGHLSTNCTILRNTLSGDDVRGVDGITGNGASSGHLIDSNTIMTHGKYCRSETRTVDLLFYSGALPVGAVFTDTPSCTSMAPELVYRCSPSLPSESACQETEYGYVLTRVKAGDSLPDGMEGFGEDGIDLKNVRKRTPSSEDVTVITGNTIYGNTGFGGVCIADASQGVHICRNRIFMNDIGVLVTNGPNGAWHRPDNYHEEKTENVYIYRNVIYMNLLNGVKVVSDFAKPYTDEEAAARGIPEEKNVEVDFDVEGVYLVNNTIAHNYYAGVDIAESGGHGGTDSAHVDDVHLHNNLFARNNQTPATVTLEDNVSIQVSFSQCSPSTGTFSMDYNVYVGWDDGETTLSKVISVGGGKYSLSAFQTLWTSLELQGQQTDDLGEVDLASEDELLDLADTRGDLESAIGTMTFDSVLGLDYDIGRRSICAGSADAAYVTAWYDAYGGTIEVWQDYEGVASEGLDVGAFEVIGYDEVDYDARF